MSARRLPLAGVLAALSVWMSVPLVCASESTNAVVALENARREAMIAADRAALERLLSPECTYTHSTGLVHSRDELIAMLASKDVRYLSIVSEGDTVHDFGAAVVITGTQTLQLDVRGKPLTSNSRFTVVWVRGEGGAWRCAAYQSTNVPGE